VQLIRTPGRSVRVHPLAKLHNAGKIARLGMTYPNLWRGFTHRQITSSIARANIALAPPRSLERQEIGGSEPKGSSGPIFTSLAPLTGLHDLARQVTPDWQGCIVLSRGVEAEQAGGVSGFARLPMSGT
jgi:hypothetical protein